MSRSFALLVGLAVAAASGLTEAWLRMRPQPPPRELVRWQSYEDLGKPPYGGDLLLQFTAPWCGPCRKMKTTTFRDPRFLDLLREYGLRPVRLEEPPDRRRWFWQEAAKYGVSGVPALVLVTKEGKMGLPINGYLRTREVAYQLYKRRKEMSSSFYWLHPTDSVPTSPRRLVLRCFTSYRSLPPAKRFGGRSWIRQEKPPQKLREWFSAHLDLVDDEFPWGQDLQMYAYANQNQVQYVPTVILFTPDGKELARFSGWEAVDGAPGEIARIARENGYDVPDPE